MADKKISELTALTGALTAADDALVIVDTSTTTTKKIDVSELQAAPLSSGTANGVTYLNGSKVLTSGSALTFNGTNLGVGVNPLNARLEVSALTGEVFRADAAGGAFRIVADQNNVNFQAATSIQGWISGSEQMRLTSTGLGIGTSSPGYKLHTYTNSATASQIVAESASAGVNAEFIAKSSAATWRMGTNIGLTGGQWEVYGGSTPSSKIVLDSSGNLGLGVTPSAWSAFKAFEIASAGNSLWSAGSNDLRLATNGIYNGGDKYSVNGFAAMYIQTVGQHQWHTAPSGIAGNPITFTQAMTLTASGYLFLAGTSDLGGGVLQVNDLPGRWCATFSATNPTGGTYYHLNIKAGANNVGSITSTTTTTTYATSSDYRLKESIQPMTGALAKVAQLKPCTYKWKVDGSDGQGFIAHELQEVVPQCVTGTKDATRTEQYEVSAAVPATLDAEGNELTPAVAAVMGERVVPEYQGVDTSFLVATLTAALQELSAKFDAYVATHP